MKLSEKIQYCRKQAGLSQEALASRLGVSRQAVSKWETGEATPELGKLRALAEAFHVSADWLLNEEEPNIGKGEPDRAASVQICGQAAQPDWVDRAPAVLRKLLRRYGWLFGVYLAVAGFALSVLALIEKHFISDILSRTMSDLNQYPYEYPKTVMQQTFGSMQTISTVTLLAGLLVLVSGVVLAVLLRRRARKKNADCSSL